jgi:hypothetical protein
MSKQDSVRGLVLGIILMAGVALLALPSISLIATNASAYGDISIDFEHASFAGSNQTVECTLTIRGGPAVDTGGNYTYKIDLSGDNTTGSSATPSSGGSVTGVFKINITMPATAPQTLTVSVNATSKSGTSSTSTYKVRDFKIQVVVPIAIKATVYNTGSVDASNVTARFYADGILLGSQTFSVTAGSSTELSYNWTWAKVSKGAHLVTVTIDDPNNIAEFSDGNNVMSMTVYVGNQGNPLGAVLTIIVIIMGVLVGLTYLQKPVRGKKT